MRTLFTISCLALSILPSLGAAFPYITLNTHTNRVSDNGTNLTYNGTAVGGSTVTTNFVQKTGDTMTGALTVQPGNAAATTIKVDGFPLSGLSFAGGGVSITAGDGSWVFGANQYGVGVPNNSVPFFLGLAADVSLYRDAANTLALRNGTNAQAFNIYNTYTDAANYERANFGWDANTFYVRTLAAGTGTARVLALNGAGGWYLGKGGTYQWFGDSIGSILAVTDNTYDIGASGANRPRNIYAAGAVIGSALTSLGDITIGTGWTLFFGNRSTIISPTNGNLVLLNQAGTDFGRLQFGGTTASFPSLKRSTTNLVSRLADDSADTGFQAGNFVISGTTNQVTFGATNSAPSDTSTIVKWISVQVAGETNAYRLPLYQ